MASEPEKIPEKPLVVGFGCIGGFGSGHIARAFAHLVEANRLPVRVLTEGIPIASINDENLPELEHRAHVIFAVVSSISIDRPGLPSNVVPAITLWNWEKNAANLPKPDRKFKALRDRILKKQPLQDINNLTTKHFDQARFALLYLQHHGYLPKT
ncbi:MAG: hypothetical protein ABH863_05920 [Candidatus Micrarchaeota archaeon]